MGHPLKGIEVFFHMWLVHYHAAVQNRRGSNPNVVRALSTSALLQIFDTDGFG